MNNSWADIILIAITVLFAAVGWRKGLMKSIVGIVSLVLSFILAIMLSPAVADFLILIGTKERIYEKILMTIGGSGEAEWISTLPEFMRSAVEAGQNDAATRAASTISDMTVNIIAFVLVLIVARILIWIAAKILDLISKLPVLNFFNRTLGMILGAAEGILIVFIILAIISAVMPMRENPDVAQTIENSQIVKYMYECNPITKLLDKTQNIIETENDYDEATARKAQACRAS